MILSSSFLQVIKILKSNNKIISVENTDGKFRIVLSHKTNDVRKFISKYYFAYDSLIGVKHANAFFTSLELVKHISFLASYSTSFFGDVMIDVDVSKPQFNYILTQI